MPETTVTIDNFLETFDRTAIKDDVRHAEDERLQLVKKFPLSDWAQLPLERYAYGLKNPQDTFSWALENGTRHLAPLAIHGSQGFKIYFRKKDDRWWYEGNFADEEEAWDSIRYGYLQAFARATASHWTRIDELHTSRHGRNALLKALFCYFPDELLPITSTNHIIHFLLQLGVVDFDGRAQNIVNLNRLLLFKLKKLRLFEDWNNIELARLLYAWAPLPELGENEVEAPYELEHDLPETHESKAELDGPLYEKIATTLAYKGQVILFGPPGTGKTYTAENFAKQWLRDTGDSSAEAANEHQHWIVVSNYQNRSWNNLFAKGKEIFRGGKLKGNFKAAQKGDLIFGYTGAPKQKIEAIARISRELFIDEDNVHCIELEPVARVKHGVSFDDLQKNAALKKSESVQSNMRGTLFKLTTKEADALLKLSVKKEPELAEILQIAASTKVATATSQTDKLIRLTFHSSYSYEDFIEGFRPDSTVSDNLTLKLKDGIFKRICKEATSNRNVRYLILIDEFNRANIAKVFGEVITVIEKDKRDLSVELPQSNDQFHVPPNVFIIGTMNTSDRSVKQLDTAIRRRFSFISMQPDACVLAGAKIGAIDLGALLEHLNTKLVESSNRDKQIGHAFFMQKGKPLADVSSFARIFRQDIIPLLEEHCYDNFSDLANFIGTELIDLHRDCFREEKINDDARLVAAIAKVIASHRHDD